MLSHICLLLLVLASPAFAFAQRQASSAAEKFTFRGLVLTVDGKPEIDAVVSIGPMVVHTDQNGGFQIGIPRGSYEVRVHTPQSGYRSLPVTIDGDQSIEIRMPVNTSVVVLADAAADILTPDPSTQAYDRKDLITANPGRPGAPFAIPGFPSETASGGIKAPQYFAPGVAGDHGEPVAQFFNIGGFLFQNNLTANAHGNGYSDPNIVIPATISAISVDDAAFNARYGDHALNLAVTYDLGSRFTPFLAATTDGRDADLSGAWSPKNQAVREWAAFEASAGNGFLARPEERQQYKLNFYRTWTPGKHELTAFFLAYYGFSRISGLIPLYTPVTNDTIDPRQADLTHTTLSVLTDRWHLSDTKLLQLSGYERTYSLSLKSDFGLGLIQQSEFRTVTGGNATYEQKLATNYSLLAGLDLRRDAPRGLNLEHADANGVFHLVTSNDLTITDAAPFLALNGIVNRNLQFYAGVRRDEIDFNNVDRIVPANSFNHWPGTTSPRCGCLAGSSLTERPSSMRSDMRPSVMLSTVPSSRLATFRSFAGAVNWIRSPVENLRGSSR